MTVFARNLLISSSFSQPCNQTGSARLGFYSVAICLVGQVTMN